MRRRKSKEFAYYENIKMELSRLFGEKKVENYFEITHKKFSVKLKKTLDDITFFLLKKQYPDIMGFVITPKNDKLFVVAEIKDKEIKLKDVFQAKMYAEIFKAEYCFLVSTRPLPEEIRRMLQAKEWLIRYTKPVKLKMEEEKEYYFPGRMFFAQYDEENDEILDYSWFPDNPFVNLLKK